MSTNRWDCSLYPECPQHRCKTLFGNKGLVLVFWPRDAKTLMKHSIISIYIVNYYIALQTARRSCEHCWFRNCWNVTRPFPASGWGVGMRLGMKRLSIIFWVTTTYYIHSNFLCGSRLLRSGCALPLRITKHGSTWYIGMAQVPRHRFHTFEKSQYHFQFQWESTFAWGTYEILKEVHSCNSSCCCCCFCSSVSIPVTQKP